MADRFEELMNKLRNPGDDGPDETIYDDLNAVYMDRIGGATAKVQELETERDKYKNETQRLMAENYTLLTQIPQGNPPAPTSETSQEDDEPRIKLSDIISYG